MSNPLIWVIEGLRKKGEQKRRYRKRICFYNSIVMLAFAVLMLVAGIQEEHWLSGASIAGLFAVPAVLVLRWSLTAGP